LESQAISTQFRHNDQIRISPIRLINDKEEQVGLVSTADALRMAREAGLDLVEVAPTARPPVCRIMDYGKWRYQQQKKEDKSRANSRGGRLKQLNIDTVRIGDHDLLIKMNHAREFLKEGNKVQFTLRFKGREMAHLDLGRLLMNKIKAELFLVSKVERDAKMEGRRMTLVLQPDHKNPATAKPQAAQPPQSAGALRSAPMSAGSGLNIPSRPAPAAAGDGTAPATTTPATPAAPARPSAATPPAAARPGSGGPPRAASASHPSAPRPAPKQPAPQPVS
jgi:translation initiation factor IF-3